MTLIDKSQEVASESAVQPPVATPNPEPKNNDSKDLLTIQLRGRLSKKQLLYLILTIAAIIGLILFFVSIFTPITMNGETGIKKDTFGDVVKFSEDWSSLSQIGTFMSPSAIDFIDYLAGGPYLPNTNLIALFAVGWASIAMLIVVIVCAVMLIIQRRKIPKVERLNNPWFKPFEYDRFPLIADNSNQSF